jgi:hypothetical protein
VSFDITSEQNTDVEVFWATDDTEWLGFSQEKSISKTIMAGQKTQLEFYITNDSENDIKRLRIDPGTVPGNYKIENIEIFHDNIIYSPDLSIKYLTIVNSGVEIANSNVITQDFPNKVELKAYTNDQGYCDPIIYFPVEPSDRPRNYQVNFDITSEQDTDVEVFWATDDAGWWLGFSPEKSMAKTIKAGEKTRLEFFITNDSENDVKRLRIDPGTVPGNYKIENIEIIVYDFIDYYINAVNERRSEPFVIEKFSQNHITGTVEAKGDRILFFSIPYDKGWKMKIDGEPVDIQKVNIGFIGAAIGPGKHYVELKYRTPGLLLGGILSAVGLVMFILMIVFRKKLTFLNITESGQQ